MFVKVLFHLFSLVGCCVWGCNVHMYVGIHTLLCTRRDQRRMSVGLLLCPLNLGLGWWPTSPSDAPVSASVHTHSIGTKQLWSWPALYDYYGDLNFGPSAYRESSLAQSPLTFSWLLKWGVPSWLWSFLPVSLGGEYSPSSCDLHFPVSY